MAIPGTRRMGQQVATTIILVAIMATGVLSVESGKQNSSYWPDSAFGINDKVATSLRIVREVERLIPIRRVDEAQRVRILQHTLETCRIGPSLLPHASALPVTEVALPN